MITYEFYRDTYDGAASEEDFVRVAAEVYAVIRALIYPAAAEDMTGAQLDGFLRAVCMQADYRLDGSPGRVVSESLGDRSVTYERETAQGVTVMGVAVAPAAAAMLEACGCLRRWV